MYKSVSLFLSTFFRSFLSIYEYILTNHQSRLVGSLCTKWCVICPRPLNGFLDNMCFLIPFIKVLRLSCDNLLSWERILHTVDYPISETTKRSSLLEDPTRHSIGAYRSNVNPFVFYILLSILHIYILAQYSENHIYVFNILFNFCFVLCFLLLKFIP